MTEAISSGDRRRILLFWAALVMSLWMAVMSLADACFIMYGLYLV